MQNYSSGAQPAPLYTMPHLVDKEQAFTKYDTPCPQPAINFMSTLFYCFPYIGNLIYPGYRIFAEFRSV